MGATILLHSAEPALAPEVRLRFFLPSPALAPYVTTYYHMAVERAGPDGIEDHLHPEWANIRFSAAADLAAGVGKEPLRPVPQLVATGPTSLATRFVARKGGFWGIGLLPLGWLRFVRAPAHDYADRFCDGATDPAFACFTPLIAALSEPGRDLADQARLIDAHLITQSGDHARDEDAVRAVHAALVDPQVGSVAHLAEQAGMATRTLERFSREVFGFPPKLLLRRQRFLRSLAQFMLDPSLSWLSTLDYHYHDQAHFVRDFRRFMTMAPSEYRQRSHPVLMAAARGRAEAAGAAVQALHQPTGPA